MMSLAIERVTKGVIETQKEKHFWRHVDSKTNYEYDKIDKRVDIEEWSSIHNKIIVLLINLT